MGAFTVESTFNRMNSASGNWLIDRLWWWECLFILLQTDLSSSVHTGHSCSYGLFLTPGRTTRLSVQTPLCSLTPKEAWVCVCVFTWISRWWWCWWAKRWATGCGPEWTGSSPLCRKPAGHTKHMYGALKEKKEVKRKLYEYEIKQKINHLVNFPAYITAT